MQSRSGYTDKEAGFSLIEILVVLAVIASVTSVLVSGLSRTQQTMTPFEFANVLRTSLAKERLLAISSGNPSDLFFDLREGVLNVTGTDIAHKIPDGMELSILTGQELQPAPHTAAIRFLPDGSSTGGKIYIKSKNHNPVEISINWLTGISSISVDQL